MKYFIDFEATQFSGEIISVGCVDENGREFYSLMRPQKMRRLTGFITELTGITETELEAAPDSDEAFSRFFDWLSGDGRASFYCYGNCDKVFVRSTLRYVSGFKAQCALGLILSDLTDYSLAVSDHFGIRQSVALAKVAAYYSGKDTPAHHNALEDAERLKYVYEMSNGEEPEDCPFPEYIVPPGKNAPSLTSMPRFRITAQGRNSTVSFSSYGKAADWVMRELMAKNIDISEKTKSSVSNRIVSAVRNNRKYYGWSWAVVSNKKTENGHNGQT